MKAVVIVSALLLGSLTSLAAQARDPCKALACMSGMAGIAGGSQAGECAVPTSEFFAIIVTRKGKFKPGDTAQKRRDYLNSCPGSDATSDGGSNPTAVDTIIAKFGGVRR